MRRTHLLVSVLLLVSLFIYLFYRTEQTIINQLMIRILSLHRYREIRNLVNDCISLSDLAIYSLPEGLWILCITLTSKPFFVQLPGFKIELRYLPIIFAAGLELLQLSGLTHGWFDFRDLIVSFCFWLFGMLLFKQPIVTRNIINPVLRDNILCLMSYFIVYLAHV